MKLGVDWRRLSDTITWSPQDFAIIIHCVLVSASYNIYHVIDFFNRRLRYVILDCNRGVRLLPWIPVYSPPWIRTHWKSRLRTWSTKLPWKDGLCQKALQRKLTKTFFSFSFPFHFVFSSFPKNNLHKLLYFVSQSPEGLNDGRHFRVDLCYCTPKGLSERYSNI